MFTCAFAMCMKPMAYAGFLHPSKSNSRVDASGFAFCCFRLILQKCPIQTSYICLKTSTYRQLYRPLVLFFLLTALPFPFGAVVLLFSRTSKSSAPDELDGAHSSSSISDSESVAGLGKKREVALFNTQIGTRTRAVSLIVGWASSLGCDVLAGAIAL